MESSRTLSTFVRSRLFAGIVTGIGITLLVLCIFEGGVAVGYHEATFSSRWGQNYGSNFGGGDFGMDKRQPMANGTVGKILSISPQDATTTIVIDGSTHPEQKVEISKDTIIRSQENTISASSLSVGMTVVVLGAPADNGSIDAKLVRVTSSVHLAPSTPSTTSSPYAAP